MCDLVKLKYSYNLLLWYNNFKYNESTWEDLSLAVKSQRGQIVQYSLLNLVMMSWKLSIQRTSGGLFFLLLQLKFNNSEFRGNWDTLAGKAYSQLT